MKRHITLFMLLVEFIKKVQLQTHTQAKHKTEGVTIYRPGQGQGSTTKHANEKEPKKVHFLSISYFGWDVEKQILVRGAFNNR